VLANGGAVAGAVALPDPQLPSAAGALGLALGVLALVRLSAAWAVAGLLLVEFSLSDYIIPEVGASARLVVTLAALLAAAPALSTAIGRARTLASPEARRVVLPSVVFLGLAAVGNVLHSDMDFVIKYGRYQSVLLATLVLVCCVVRDEADLRRVAWSAVAIAAIASLVAVWQHFDSESAPYVGITQAGGLYWKGRALGLAASPVTLASQTSYVLVGLLGLIACGPLRADRQRIGLAALTGLVGLGMYFAYTRSALLGVGAGLAVIASLLSGTRRTVIAGVLAVGLALFFVVQNTGLVASRYYRTSSNDRSAASHEALLNVGVAILMADPLNAVVGIGHESFEEQSAELFDEIDPALQTTEGASAIGRDRPHNDFLSIWISWGGAALCAYVLIFVGAVRNFAEGARRGTGLVRALNVGCAGALAAYAVNSALHNNLDSSVAQWLLCGLSVPLRHLSTASHAGAARRYLERALAGMGSRGRRRARVVYQTHGPRALPARRPIDALASSDGAPGASGRYRR
jgi:hypothetical protein